MLLDFSTPFDDAKINLFDQVVQAMYSNNPQDVSVNYLLKLIIFHIDGQSESNFELI